MLQKLPYEKKKISSASKLKQTTQIWQLKHVPDENDIVHLNLQRLTNTLEFVLVTFGI